jgi:hypothetical protein
MVTTRWGRRSGRTGLPPVSADHHLASCAPGSPAHGRTGPRRPRASCGSKRRIRSSTGSSLDSSTGSSRHASYASATSNDLLPRWLPDVTEAARPSVEPAPMLRARWRPKQHEPDLDLGPSGRVSPGLPGSIAVIDGVHDHDPTEHQVLLRNGTDGLVGRNAGAPTRFQASPKPKHGVLNDIHRQMDCADVLGQGCRKGRLAGRRQAGPEIAMSISSACHMPAAARAASVNLESSHRASIRA